MPEVKVEMPAARYGFSNTPNRVDVRSVKTTKGSTKGSKYTRKKLVHRLMVPADRLATFVSELVPG